MTTLETSSFTNQPRRLGSMLGPLLGLCLLIYFAYHIFQGERGFFAWMRLQKKIAEDEITLSTLQSQREILERQVHLLRPDNLDPDMLEERARLILNFARPDEVIIYNEGLEASEPSQGKS
ncbi:FtsB family cell division protein [Candidatus Finniella inopinata]|uniref:Septum formation initiator family protein n=1 Tax=Candidatus Finniella inopinata TaxID=1696036 RepID=A0A4Q7DKB8_9PROT|nr:septum formation initiator family protein [Candidatus Finniella inopinata]RZI46514.1 septum formation initiator family protein [Candidatus Finniella inopinata]